MKIEMMNMQLFLLLAIIFFLPSCIKNNEADGNPYTQAPLGDDNTPPPSTTEVIGIIRSVNDYWQSTNGYGDASWSQAVYHIGNMAAYDVTGEEKYKSYSSEWAEMNHWEGATSDDQSEWKYSAGMTGNRVLFADWQACFQVYIDLYNLDNDDRKISRTKEVMDYQINTKNNDYWWWIDALYMAMPVMTRLYKMTNNIEYLNKLYEYFLYTKNLLYDPYNCLFYRDTNYIFPEHKTISGLKDFWSRGNGWAFAALARVLQDLPENNAHRDEFIQVYKDMAKTLATFQQKEGYWTRSLLDPNQSIGYETSGTAFFVYGFLWGVNNGILDRSYISVINRGWKYLINIALQDEGKVGYVQPVGGNAIPGQELNRDSTADFGVGSFLLAASEMYKFSNDYYEK